MSGSSSWQFAKKDAVYAVVLAAGLGGTQLMDRKSAVNLDVLSERVTVLEKTVAELRDPGGPVLRETVNKVRGQDDKLREVEREVRSGVSRESMDEVKARLAEAKETDREIRQQIEALRGSIEGMRMELSQALGRRLVGPAR